MTRFYPPAKSGRHGVWRQVVQRIAAWVVWDYLDLLPADRSRTSFIPINEQAILFRDMLL